MNDYPSSLPFITATNGKLEKEKKEDQRNYGMEWSFKQLTVREINLSINISEIQSV